MNPVFSIIIPVYNVAPYLRECLDSVLAQTFADWEAICVDDGSTDGSGAILDEYAAKDARFRIVHQENAGVSVARNVALDVARGVWIGFVDADDVISPEWFLICHMNLTWRPDCQVVKMMDHGWVGGCIPTAIEKWNAEWHEDTQDIVKYVSSCITGYCIARYIFRKDVIENQKFIEGVRINEDVIFVSRILFSISSLCVCSYDGYFYRKRHESALHRGISDNDIKVFIDGICRSIGASGALNSEVLIAYKRWAGRRISVDVLRCLVFSGVYPYQSIAAIRKMCATGTIRLDNLRGRLYISMSLLLHGGKVGFVCVWIMFRLMDLYRRVWRQ